YVTDTLTFSDSLSIEGTYNPVRAWWHQESTMYWHLENIQAIYATGEAPPNSAPFKLELDAFFLACWHMRDWIANDNYLLPAISVALIDKYVNTSLPLKRCRAYANTIKHFELDRSDKLTMRKVGFKSDETGMSVSLEFWSSVQP